MKRILMLFIAFAAVVSCLNKSTFSQSSTVVATFEYEGADYDKLFGTDSLYYDAQTEHKQGIGWEYLAFYHNIDKTTSEFKGGFMLSYLNMPKSGSAEGLQNNKYRSNAGPSKAGANTFVVFEQTESMPEHDMGFTFVSSGGSTGLCTMNSCQVTNTVAMADSIKTHFVLGDKLLLKAKGYLDGKETGSAEMTLAEFTSAKDSIVSSWTTFDLSKLGAIDRVDFEIVGGHEGKELPMTVCIDNMVTNISLTY